MPEKMTDQSIAETLGKLPGWEKTENGLAIRKSFKFKDFSEAWAFMSRAALLAERMDHHPEWFNVYSRVDVTLNTHDAGGVTELDIKLARAMDRFAG
jgi:4a-hydroxytetrahydrobiopterin dehydratase